jgi:hypothetical protein
MIQVGPSSSLEIILSDIYQVAGRIEQLYRALSLCHNVGKSFECHDKEKVTKKENPRRPRNAGLNGKRSRSKEVEDARRT